MVVKRSLVAFGLLRREARRGELKAKGSRKPADQIMLASKSKTGGSLDGREWRTH